MEENNLENKSEAQLYIETHYVEESKNFITTSGIKFSKESIQDIFLFIGKNFDEEILSFMIDKYKQFSLKEIAISLITFNDEPHFLEVLNKKKSLAKVAKDVLIDILDIKKVNSSLWLIDKFQIKFDTYIFLKIAKVGNIELLDKAWSKFPGFKMGYTNFRIFADALVENHYELCEYLIQRRGIKNFSKNDVATIFYSVNGKIRFCSTENILNGYRWMFANFGTNVFLSDKKYFYDMTVFEDALHNELLTKKIEIIDFLLNMNPLFDFFENMIFTNLISSYEYYAEIFKHIIIRYKNQKSAKDYLLPIKKILIDLDNHLCFISKCRKLTSIEEYIETILNEYDNNDDLYFNDEEMFNTLYKFYLLNKPDSSSLATYKYKKYFTETIVDFIKKFFNNHAKNILTPDKYEELYNSTPHPI